MSTFCVIVTGRNCVEQAESCLESIASQEGPHEVRVAVVDDASTDGTSEIVEAHQWRAGWSIQVNTVRVGAMQNQWDCWRSFNADPDDIVIWCDLDDRLEHENVLNILDTRYRQSNALVSYGSYRSEPFAASCQMAKPYPQEVARKRAFRQWIRSGKGIFHNHIRAMRYSVLDQIREEDCKDDNGDWWMTGPDMAVFLPAMEIAGPRTVFIPDVLYVYTSSLETAEWVDVPDLVRANHQAMLARPPRVPTESIRRPLTAAERVQRVRPNWPRVG